MPSWLRPWPLEGFEIKEPGDRIISILASDEKALEPRGVESLELFNPYAAGGQSGQYKMIQKN